ncbi:hypothetical protein Ahy_B01g052748 isoform A [Arachis hypogaea]|uniref:Uncharacterized protein n=1 Tax=Arachis hypogaea TaxID=3818 RepID=A0A445AQ87_ARAHY|nr:hypothetical protein Ahy_B01g052748 isoform A [Arachis hypogaea]
MRIHRHLSGCSPLSTCNSLSFSCNPLSLFYNSWKLQSVLPPPAHPPSARPPSVFTLARKASISTRSLLLKPYLRRR